MRLATSAALLLVLAASLPAARADDVVTKSGTSFTGKIVAEDEATVTVDTLALGRMRILRTDIVSVRRDGPAADGAKPGPKAGEPPVPKSGKGPTEAPSSPAAPASGPKPTEKPAAKPAKADPATLSAEQRDDRRRATKIVRRTAPTSAGGAADAKQTSGAEDEKASVGGSQLARAETGSFVIVVQPPRLFDAAPAAVQLGRRLYARLDSVGAASAWLAVPNAGGDRRIALRLADVQRHVVAKPGSSRMRMLEGVDKGSWLRIGLDDGTVVQGVLQTAMIGVVVLTRCRDDGTTEKIDVSEDKIVEIDGLMRATTTRLALAEMAAGEPIGLTLWPDGREVVGVLKERGEKFLKVTTQGGELVQMPADGPIADVRRLPTKWRSAVLGLEAGTLAHARCGEDFADSRVERDVVGSVLATTAYAVTLETPEGALAIPFETVAEIGPVENEREAAAAHTMAKSDRRCDLPVLPGDPAEKAKGLDAAKGVSVVTDGKSVQNVFVTAPFDGQVYGVQLGNRVEDACDRTDLRFETRVTPRDRGPGDPRPAELISNSLAGVRVTLLLDSVGSVCAVEIAAR